jgi:hypothetical protein
MVVHPPWRMPHTFEWLKAGTSVTSTPLVFTYGLTVTELCRAPSLADQRLLDRVGLPWVIDLDNELSAPGGSVVLRECLPGLGISRPGQESTERWLPSKPVPQLEQDVLTELAGKASERVGGFIARELAPFAADLEAAAPGHKPSLALAPPARRFTREYGRFSALVSTRARSTGKPGWGFVFETLRERIAGEIAFLYLYERPTLKRCVLCQAVFVSRDKRANCHWTLWDSNTEAELQRCSPIASFEDWERRETTLAHQRNRKRLNERVRQELLRADGDEGAPRVVRAAEARDEYMKIHGRPRGRPQRVSTPTVDVVLEKPKQETDGN